jgi:hypothetical protein
MKNIFMALITILVLFTVGQGSEKQYIINSGEHYHGTGISHDISEARDHALKELTGQIAVQVASSFKTKVEEAEGDINTSVESIVSTHSAATLKNVRSEKRLLKDGRVEVFCYLEKTMVEKIFNERKKLIAEIVRMAGRYTIERNIAYALKLYYFATILLNSLPDQNIIYNDINFTTEIPLRVNEIILNTSMSFFEDRYVDEKERLVTLKADYKGQPISLLDFTFWDGSNQVSVQARDGLATFSLLGSSVEFEKLRVNIKYAYYECRHEYNIVASLWALVSKPSFNSQKNIPLIQKTPEQITAEISPPVGKPTGFNIELSYDGDDAPMDSIILSTQKYLDLLEKADSLEINKFYAADSFLYEKISNYMKFNNGKPLEKNIRAKLNKTRNGWELRRIRMHQKYPSINKETTEYMVLDFSETGELIDMNLSTTDYLYREFVDETSFGDDWGNRQEIVKFLEKYRTAYMSRDIGTVGLMFAEEALIIIGRIIKTKKLPSDVVKYQKLGNQPDVEYLRFAKSEYLARQETIFKSQKDIFLDFGSFNIIKKNNSPNIYGVEMRQSYVSTTYSDEGYLFLLIDFNEEDPLIYVRAWQPNAWNQDELIKTANFRIYK